MNATKIEQLIASMIDELRPVSSGRHIVYAEDGHIHIMPETDAHDKVCKICTVTPSEVGHGFTVKKWDHIFVEILQLKEKKIL